MEVHCLLPRPPAHVVPGCRVHVQGEGGEYHPRCAAHLQLCCRADGAAGAHRRPGALQRGQVRQTSGARRRGGSRGGGEGGGRCRFIRGDGALEGEVRHGYVQTRARVQPFRQSHVARRTARHLGRALCRPWESARGGRTAADWGCRNQRWASVGAHGGCTHVWSVY